MIIYQMTATFGKLDHQTLTLEPGMNIITAPNEWGKSTWCAFLIAMLYGMDTRAKTTKNALADKDRYAPWSGAPMEGRIDLNWQGRDITIQRKSTRRIPLGDFYAYETKTGIPVPELTAANCGQTLLGVEQSVFRRAGFIRHADLPVTQDEAFRRRLNDLVTTGDETGAADRLADTLKELRNKCRYNRSGLIPQAESERDTLEGKLLELDSLEQQCARHKQQIEELKVQIDRLTNHRQTMAYASYQENASRSAQAKEDLDAASTAFLDLEQTCRDYPTREQLLSRMTKVQQFQAELEVLHNQAQQLPAPPAAPPIPAPFENMTMEQARATLHKDAQDYVSAKHTGMAILLLISGLFGLLAAGFLIFLRSYAFAAASAVGSVAALIWGIRELITMKKCIRQLQSKYGCADHTRWAIPLAEYDRLRKQYLAAAKEYKQSSEALHNRMKFLISQLESLCSPCKPREFLGNCSQMLHNLEALEAARREAQRAQTHYDSLNTLAKPVQKPTAPDTLNMTEGETLQQLAERTTQLQQLQNRLGQHQGRMESLGNPADLRSQLAQKQRRITALENTYGALSIAQETLAKAREELQRRFAPKITRQAQAYLSQMTHGRYNSVTMDTELALKAGAVSEDVLRDACWRSDGTMDQLYLALRLAVAEALTPGTPLILDDVLVRFDDQRMASALDVLDSLSGSRQVILFSCHSREQPR
ncbi:MAG: AAA family ATPase [Oscillospiraceae bacterium]|nr:AAA family ATPase [Oscillospiraceae bacterium]